MRIDAHQHFWDFEANAMDYVWMTDEYSSLRQNFGPVDLKPLLEIHGFQGTVAVQARELDDENDYLLALAATYPFILGVVGWLDLCHPDVESLIELYAENPRLKGLRMLLHDRTDPGFAVSPDHVRGVGLLERYNLSYDLLIKPQHLEPARRLVDLFPNQRFVVDHIAKPNIAAGSFEPWARDIAELARRGNVCCKLSSMITQSNWSGRSVAQFAPYLEHALDIFGPARLMIGSDWPVCTVAADYGKTMNLVTTWASRLSEDEQDAILGNTCARFYDLGPTHG